MASKKTRCSKTFKDLLARAYKDGVTAGDVAFDEKIQQLYRFSTAKDHKVPSELGKPSSKL